jgi:hypothetical protein
MKPLRGGLALLEAVVATAIIGFVSVAVLMTLAEQLRASREVGPALLASEIGRGRLMKLRLTPSELLMSLPDSLLAGIEETPSGEFFWRTTVEDVPGQPALLESTVSVVGAGRFSVSTYFFKSEHAAFIR